MLDAQKLSHRYVVQARYRARRDDPAGRRSRMLTSSQRKDVA
jgi:hypothetical protein